MKERPILFSGEMVRAILEGRKTQTRRMVKPQPPCLCEYEINGAKSHALCFHRVEITPEGNCRGSKPARLWVPPTPKSKDHRLPCPFGVPGDRLYVRETWSCMEQKPHAGCEVAYRADLNGGSSQVWEPWAPSIHMPRWASRITLEVTNVRVERLQDISEADALAEGVTIKPNAGIASKFLEMRGEKLSAAQLEFWHLWQSVYKSWDDNPWVWVVEFSRA